MHSMGEKKSMFEGLLHTHSFFMLIAIMLSALVFSVGTADASGKIPFTVDLNGDWAFAYKPDVEIKDGVPVLPTDEAYAATMSVPGLWDDNHSRLSGTSIWVGARFIRPNFGMGWIPESDSTPNLVGTGFYRKKMEIPADWEDLSVKLYIGGVRLNSWVWINGKLVSNMSNYFMPYTFDISSYLKPGEQNEFIIAASNSIVTRNGFDTDWGLYRYAYARDGGVTRPVYLKIASKTSITDLYVRPQEKNTKLLWALETDGSGGREYRIDWSVRPHDGEKVLLSGHLMSKDTNPSWTTESHGIAQWSDKTPNLYDIEVAIRDGDHVLDTIKQSFGMRSIETAGNTIRINGNPLYLRGACEGFYYAETCNAPSDVESYRREIGKQKEIGFNFLRLHTHAPSEEYMQAADELGMYFQVEPGTLPDEEWAQFIKVCRKHPSVVLYCCGNEFEYTDAAVEMTRNVSKLVKKYAPDALFNPGEAPTGIEWLYPGATEKGVVTEPYVHNGLRISQLREFSDVYTHFGWGLASYRSTKNDWREFQKRVAGYGIPLLTHELGINGCYMNFELEHRYKGTRYGTDYYRVIRQNLEKQGLIGKAKEYYTASCAWQRIIRKHCVETIRMVPALSGYNYLGAIDIHNHANGGYNCGFLNEFYETKPGETIQDILKYNGESVILLDCTNRRNYSSGDKCSYGIMSSVYGHTPLKNGKLLWSLVDDQGNKYGSGEISLRNIANGKVENLGKIEWMMPRVSNPAKLTLNCRLIGGEYDIVNDWNFWVFPGNSAPDIRAGADNDILAKYGKRFKGLAAPSSKDVLRVVMALDAQTLDFLNAGGRVLLLDKQGGSDVKTAFPEIATGFQNANSGRPHGNLAVIVGNHPITRTFPNDGYADWQFYSMLEGGGAVVFNDLNMPFDTIIEVVSSFKDVKKQSNLFEVGVSSGKLLVCTMNLDDLSDPATVYMLDRLMSYASGEHFQPRASVTIEQARGWLELKHKRKPRKYGGPVTDPNDGRGF